MKINIKVTEEEFIKECDHRGIKWYRSGKNIMICCPFHGEKTPSFGINFSKGQFNCLSCGEKGYSWYAYYYMFGNSIEKKDDSDNLKTVDKDDIKYLKTRLKIIDCCGEEKIKILNDSAIEKHPMPHGEYAKYLLSDKRKINEISWLQFNIRCGYWKGDQRVLIPMYDEFNRLVSITGRSITTDEQKLKVRKVKDSDVSKILFNLNNVLENNMRKVVVVEGEFDTIYLHQQNVSVVGVGKKHLSEWQLIKLSKYFDVVGLALDGDVTRRQYYPILKSISEYVDEVVYIQLPENKDPNKLTEKEVTKIFKEWRFK